MNALILVDIQNDFLPGGALAVPHGDEVVAVANRLMPAFPFVVATQDWHPADHLSFASQHTGQHVGDRIDLDGLEQILWPVHCIAGTTGAQFATELATESIQYVIYKGTNRNIDSYSGFFDNGHRQATGLQAYLNDRHITRVFILGLATDYCVKFTALDAHQLGFDVHLISDGCRGVNQHAGDVTAALAELQAAGVNLITSDEVIQQHEQQQQ